MKSIAACATGGYSGRKGNHFTRFVIHLHSLVTLSHSYGYGGGAGVLSMVTGSKNNETPTSNIPSTAQAFVAPKKAPVVATSARFNIGTNTCPRCSKGQSRLVCNQTSLTSFFVFLQSGLHGRESNVRWLRKFGFVFHIRFVSQFWFVCLYQAWHKNTCFNCKECRKRLDPGSLCERESEIYCKSKCQMSGFF